MTYRKLCFLMSLVLVLSVMMPATVRAGELLTNPGFETGLEAPWYNYTETGGTSAVQSGSAHSGDYWWELTSGTSFISGLQDIGNPPEPVTLSAYLRNSGTSALDVEFGFDYYPDPMAAPWWYGQSIIALSLPADSTWHLISFEEFDTGATGYVGTSITSRPVDAYIMKAKIALAATSPSSALCIDDASAIPEPATMALLGLGSLTLLRKHRRKR